MKDDKFKNTMKAIGRITRLDLGEAWMWCSECGSKLYSFDGIKDQERGCPYRNNQGECVPK